MAIRFGAIGDSLSLSSNLPSITGFTLMGWLYRVVDRGAVETPFAYGATASSNYYGLSIDSSAGDPFNMWNGSTNQFGTVNTVLAQWYHAAMVVSGTGAGQVAWYIDGAAQPTMAGNGSVTATKLWIGNDRDSEWLNGRAAAVKCWNAVLSAAEISAEMGTVQAVRKANIVGVWPLDVMATATRDYSGNGNTLTAAGALSEEQNPPSLRFPSRALVAPATRPAAFRPGLAR